MAVEIWALWLVGAFLCGSIPFAVILGKLNGVDIRKMGSGNPGASNLGRQVGKKWGIVCFFLDVGKGLVPVVGYFLLWPIFETYNTGWQGYGFNKQVEFSEISHPILAVMWVFVAIAAVLGHVFSPFLRFKGGKGVATGLGAALGLFPIVTVPAGFAFVLWYAVCKASGYVGLASVIAAASLPVMTVAAGVILGLSGGEIAVFASLTALLAAVVIARHRGNLARIRAGTEPKAAWTGRANTE
ncbi:MAG: glycerol-3-phosphate 1-O-acyltransferase PlsY [Planctomycetota bacterium]